MYLLQETFVYPDCTVVPGPTTLLELWCGSSVMKVSYVEILALCSYLVLCTLIGSCGSSLSVTHACTLSLSLCWHGTPLCRHTPLGVALPTPPPPRAAGQQESILQSPRSGRSFGGVTHDISRLPDRVTRQQLEKLREDLSQALPEPLLKKLIDIEVVRRHTRLSAALWAHVLSACTHAGTYCVHMYTHAGTACVHMYTQGTHTFPLTLRSHLCRHASRKSKKCV